jgi:hypothetical protein
MMDSRPGAWRYDNKHNDVQHYDTQHNNEKYDTQYKTLSLINTQHNWAECHKTIMLSVLRPGVVLLNVVMPSVVVPGA